MASAQKFPLCGSPDEKELSSIQCTSRDEAPQAEKSRSRSASCSELARSGSDLPSSSTSRKVDGGKSGTAGHRVLSQSSTAKNKAGTSDHDDSSTQGKSDKRKIRADKKPSHVSKLPKNPSCMAGQGEKRRIPSQSDRSGAKKKKAGEGVYENRAVRDFGHLVIAENSKKRVKHVLGTLSIPEEPNADSEFEDELFVKEGRIELWGIYKSLVRTILNRSKLEENQQDRLRVLMFDVFMDEDCPMLCPIRGCIRKKLLYSRLAFLRHVTEAHLPESPWWKCPSVDCGGKQPRKIALVRHLGWFHQRSYSLAAAITLKEDLLEFSDNPTFVKNFEVMGRKAPEFYRKVEEQNPNVRSPVKDQTPVEEHPFEAVDFSQEPECEIFEEVLSMVALDETAPEVEPEKKESSKTEPLGGAEGAEGGRIPIPVMELDETAQATATLVGLMQAADLETPEAKQESHPLPGLKRIPELFLFDKEDPPHYRDEDTESVELLTARLRRLTTISNEQSTLCEGMAKEMGRVRRMADIHEGSLKLTSEQTQEIIDLRRQKFHLQQINGEISRERDAVISENLGLKEQLRSRNKAVALLELHVKDLQTDVRRHQRELSEAERLLRETKDKEPLMDLASKVAEILKKGGL